MASFEIMFNDLTPEAKANFLEYMGIDDPSEGNYEVVPIATIDYEPDEKDGKDDLVTSREVDCPCDCGDCEHADKCTENGRYDFEEDDDDYKDLNLTVAPGDIEVSEDDKDHAILLRKCFFHEVQPYRWYSAEKVYLSFVGDMDDVLRRPYAMIERWDVEEQYDNGNLGIRRHQPI